MTLSTKSIKVRLFITCWVIFSLHFATDISREHFLTLAIADNHSFRLDEYAGMHNDIFITPEHGAHHGANPGASMIAAVPYIFFKPFVDRVVSQTATNRAGLPDPVYTDDRPERVKFYKKAWRKGLDIKFGLVGFITLVFCMAPLSAASSVVIFGIFRRCALSNRLSLMLALLYAFGTPIFFRTGYLNQNLMVAVFSITAFAALWRATDEKEKTSRRYAWAGFLGGLALLTDYSGMIPLALLGCYALFARTGKAPFAASVRDTAWFVAGAAGPILMLWFYQYMSFGHPFYPPQHFMPHQLHSELGYQGITMPTFGLLKDLLFNHQYGLFVASPFLILAVAAPILSRYKKNIIPWRETLFMLAFSVALTIFFSSVQYTRIQWITGIRYIIPIVPFMFILTAAVLIRLPRGVSIGIGMLAILESWSMSMVRRIDVPAEGIISNLQRLFIEGFQLPWLNTLSKTAAQYAPNLDGGGGGISPLPFFLVTGVMIYLVWRVREPWQSFHATSGDANNDDLRGGTDR
jgi:hypothetical protein